MRNFHIPMIAVKEENQYFTPEEYFCWEEQQLEKHELIDGRVYAMSGGTKNHSAIAIDIYHKNETGDWLILSYRPGDRNVNLPRLVVLTEFPPFVQFLVLYLLIVCQYYYGDE
ncbi:Uma2 family endonuclease [Cylindrospermopsis raciborskii]